MKMRKIMALALALSMAASLAGCAKVKAVDEDSFVKACEKLGAEEVDPDDLDDDVVDDLEDGIYVMLDSDDFEDAADSAGSYTSYLDTDINIPVDPDDIESAVVFIRGTGFDDVEDIDDVDDLEDLALDMVVAMQITFEDDDLADDIFDGFEDMLDDMFDMDPSDLSSREYYRGKNEGYIKVNVSVEDLVEAFYDSDVYSLISLLYEDSDDLEEVLDTLSGNISVATYIKGENCLIVIGGSLGSPASEVDAFCSKIGVASPSKIPVNQDIPGAFMDAVDDSFGSLSSAFNF